MGCLLVLYSLEESTGFSLLNALASSSNTPTSVLKTITNSLIHRALKSDSSPKRDLHHLLGSLQQRHPELVQDVSRSFIEEDEDQEEAIQQLVLSLSVVRRVYSLVSCPFSHAPRQKTSHEGDVPEVDMVVASMDGNAEMRAAAVQSMLRTLRQSTGLDPQNLVSTSVCLLRRGCPSFHFS